MKVTKKTKETPVTLAIDIARLFDAQMRIEILKNGMRASYKQLLHWLSVKDGVTQLDLVRLTKLKAPTISTTLRNMEADGLVRRETDKDDARATRVFITEKGRDMDKKLRNAAAKFEKVFLSDTSAAEKEQLISLLGKMKASMEKSSGISLDEDYIEED
jgi:DNA-binding MarR family transcriptional regulator